MLFKQIKDTISALPTGVTVLIRVIDIILKQQIKIMISDLQIYPCGSVVTEILKVSYILVVLFLEISSEGLIVFAVRSGSGALCSPHGRYDSIIGPFVIVFTAVFYVTTSIVMIDPVIFFIAI